EFVRTLVEDVDAGDVRRKEIGRELHPRKRDVERSRERLGEHRLANTRKVLEDQMALRHEAEDRETQRLLGRVDDAAEILDDRRDRLRRCHATEALSLAHAATPPLDRRSSRRSVL